MPAAARILLPTMRGETQPSSRRRDTRFSGISPIFLLQGPPEDVARAPRDLARGFHSRVSQTTPYPWLTWSARLPSTRTFRPRRGLGKRQALRRRGESSSRLVAGWDLIGAGVRRRAAGRDAAADAELEASHRRCRSFRGRHRAATRGEADEHGGGSNGETFATETERGMQATRSPVRPPMDEHECDANHGVDVDASMPVNTEYAEINAMLRTLHFARVRRRESLALDPRHYAPHQ